MYLIECLNNKETKNCYAIYNNRLKLKFSTSLEDVALIEDKDNNVVELTNGKETYILDFVDLDTANWGIE